MKHLQGSVLTHRLTPFGQELQFLSKMITLPGVPTNCRDCLENVSLDEAVISSDVVRNSTSYSSG